MTDKKDGKGLGVDLGTGSKIALPIQGGSLAMMVVIAVQLFSQFSDLPDDMAEIKDDLSTIQTDVEGLKLQGNERDKSIGSLETRVDLLEGVRDELKTTSDNLESKISSLESDRDRLETALRGECDI